MERLTQWYDDGKIRGVLVKDGYEENALQTIVTKIDECYAAVALLKEYEDTGLTPPEIMELKERDVAREAIITGYNRAIGCKVGECPKCGAMTRDYLTFCSECGQRIKWEDRT